MFSLNFKNLLSKSIKNPIEKNLCLKNVSTTCSQNKKIKHKLLIIRKLIIVKNLQKKAYPVIKITI
ncbi:hypothetical protein Q764_07035 [Flavobacterium suncheonense GH29-5 = DSM 17707]|uniref:Uncharacterized protein n=1 Tax=Flavobacterium suncheonense GH29-5 = DSM 17707 TaxID=1121899 RepID=A0A0A2MA20_9FLAO|nr:hypothetical protein Q764_07035 [Flavobacterium suncheonense GH29-5 = DSM 17707]